MSSIQTLRITPLHWAICMHESWGTLPPRGPQGELTGKRKAYKEEGEFGRRYVPESLTDDEELFQRTSFGLWQLMGLVLRELGYRGGIGPFAESADMQARYFNQEWAKKERELHRRLRRAPETWRLIEAWNKGAAGATRLPGPTGYHAKVMAKLRRCPAPGTDGLVDLVTVEKAKVT